MATAPMSADPSRLSFAKVAASAGNNNATLGSFARVASSSTLRDPRKENFPVPAQKESTEGSIQSHRPTYIKSTDELATLQEEEHSNPADNGPRSSRGENVHPPVLRSETSNAETKLIDAVKALNVDSEMPSLVVNGSGVSVANPKPEGIEGLTEDIFQRTDSGSELGTKPPSLDGKSITSGTTFALDEKESLRPDDSASVKAAEDDDTFSGRGSIVAGSRIGSEAAARAYRAQFYEAPDRRSVQPTQERQGQGINTPQSGSSQQTTDDGKSKPLVGASDVPDAFNLFYRQTPDEKLLEALESPKDRIFLLRLEQDVIEFVKDSKEPFIDLPPCNSFCRLLTHKLADYYHMTHQVDAVAGAVRIFRTPFCRLPPSLTSISNPPTTGNTPPPTMPAMKIMRRGGDIGISPSKATSEAGSDGKEKSLSAKEKQTREEREAKYNEARARIFGKEEVSGDVTPDIEEGNEMSRSSSVSAKDRAAQNKKPKPPKQRRDDSESFDRRSQYTPFYPQQPQAPTWVAQAQTPYMGGMASQPYNGAVQTSYPSAMAPQYTQPTQQYNPALGNNGSMQPYNAMPQYSQQSTQQRYQPHSAPITSYGTPNQSPQISTQQWPQQAGYQTGYQNQAPVRGPPSAVPYAFGQLPNAVNPADPKSQHPIPGSFNRHAFNPKTQSFVPNNPGLPIPQSMSHHGSPHQGSPHHGSSHHGSPHHGSPHLPYNAFAPTQQQFSNGMGYNMIRQGSNNSLPSYHASPHMSHRPMMQQGVPQGLPMQGMPQQIGTHLPNYGNPSTLPPKPPTGF
ncbi:hypothetical protein LZ554_007344 [Drepanopeziza brunnea f. sp. 'monogermtubi']|nr:hypothetical protein LZ554_007344 [Drepanopeziza brunnea f. sp. 'monogermtubi']